MLEKLGLRVGVFSSPYLIHYTDQISINGESIPEARLESLMADYQSLLEGEAAANLQGTTEFEIITAIAYDYFASEQVDVAIMEVGMGGLLDSTNVCQPILTGITTIGLDHVALLGDTLEAIAEQKAGIIKQGIPLVTGRIAPEALAVIDRIAEGKMRRDLPTGQIIRSAIKRVWLRVKSLTIQVLSDKVASRLACWVCTR